MLFLITILIPNEILLEIFNNLHLQDLSRAKRTCKRFNTIGKLVTNLNIKFYIDAPNQTAWKLIRSILADNTLGGKISRISIRWRRREAELRKSLTKYWQWTDVEKKAIGDTCLFWCLADGTRDAIISGVNSEALLPLLLCYTTRIKSLNLGEVKKKLLLFDSGLFIKRWVMQAFNSCVSEEDQGELPGKWEYTVRDLEYSENPQDFNQWVIEEAHRHHVQQAIEEAFVKSVKKHIPGISRPWDWDNYCCGLWFDENLETLGKRLPWFRKLENIEVFCRRRAFVNGSFVRLGHFCADPTKHDELGGGDSNKYSAVEEDVESSDSWVADSEDEIFPADENAW
ncbi:hypothetical protein TWF173_000969 [Orbilia oligospora]|nr:hypothetical protein TWF173_000969 [Orbilia oligospora]